MINANGIIRACLSVFAVDREFRHATGAVMIGKVGQVAEKAPMSTRTTVLTTARRLTAPEPRKVSGTVSGSLTAQCAWGQQKLRLSDLASGLHPNLTLSGEIDLNLVARELPGAFPHCIVLPTCRG
jgi:hypothetical protein